MALLLLATRRRVFGRRKVGTLAGEDEPSSIGLSRTDAMILLFLYALFAIFEIATSLSRGN